MEKSETYISLWHFEGVLQHVDPKIVVLKKGLILFPHTISCLLGDYKCVWVMILGSLANWKSGIIPILEERWRKIRMYFPNGAI